MDIRQLAYFTKVVELGSFTKAAQRLNIAQTALGFNVRNLEEELQVKLLLRHPRGVEPTEAGLRLLENARRILELAEQTRKEVRDLSGPPRGHLVIGMPSSVVLVLAAPLLRRCREAYPDIALSLVEDRSRVLLEWVQGDQLDLALAFDDPSVNGLVSEAILDEDLFFIQNAAAATGDGPVTMAEMLDHPLTMPGFSSSMRRFLEDRARAQGKPLNVLFEVRSVTAARDLAEQNVAATLLPYAAVRRPVAEGRLVARRVVEPSLSRTLFLFTLQRRPVSKAEAALRKLLLAAVADAAAELPGIWRIAAQIAID